MGTKSSKNRPKETSGEDAQGPRQLPLPPPPPPPQQRPSLMTALPEPDLPLHILATAQSSDRSSNVLTTSTHDEDITVPSSPNAIMASAIPEVYYASDMIHIDGPEPSRSIDLSVPFYMTAAGEISQAFPEPDPLYITNYVETYGVPPAPPLDAPGGIRDPNFRDSFVTIGGIKLAQPRKKSISLPTREQFIASFAFSNPAT